MMGLLSYYRAQIKTSFAVQFQYRVSMVIWMIGLVLEPVIYLVVWTTIARSSGGEVGGFSTGDFAAYYLALMVVMHATQIWHMWEYEWYIRGGVMSGRLLRPVHPIHQDASENISFKVLMLIVLIPSLAVLIIVFQPTFNPPLWALAAFVPVVIAAGVLSFVTGWIVAMAAFWTTRISAINQMYFVAMFFFSGQVAPLSLLPGAIQSIADALPFRWMLSFPTELLLGQVSMQDALSGFIAQLIWIAVIVLLLRLVWGAAVRRYSAVGG
jgi:ABC-2 type transport system permease protein